ncbi:MAG: PhoH family protein, partial [Bacteroidota bacterium]
MAEKKIRLEGVDTLGLLGLNDANLQIMENRFDANIFVRGESLTIRGNQEEVEQIEKVFKELIFFLNKNGSL